MRLAIVGCRHFVDYDLFCHHVDTWLQQHQPQHLVIITGDATGADAMAQRYADEHGLELMVHIAQWKLFGPSAGPKRNQWIVDDATHYLAFPSKVSRGTWDTIRRAQKKQLPGSVIPI